MESLRRSFKSRASSFKNMRRLSSSLSLDKPSFDPSEDNEQLPMLHDHRLEQEISAAHSSEPVDINEFQAAAAVDRNIGSNSTILRSPAIDFWEDNGGEVPREDFSCAPCQQWPMEDPPSRLTGRFLNKQKARGDVSLDVDLEMDELRWKSRRDLSPADENPSPQPSSNQSRELCVSFQPPEYMAADIKTEVETLGTHHRSSASGSSRGGGDQGEQEMVKCTSFQQKSSLLRAKTRSRLMDPADETERRSMRVSVSNHFGRAGDDQEDGDLFLEEDLLEEYKRTNWSAMTVLQWMSLISLTGALACTLAIPPWKSKDLWKLRLWKWELLVLVLICGRLVSGWGIRIIVFFIERNFLLRKRVLYFVYALRKAVQNCLWLGLVLTAWHALFDEKVERETNSAIPHYVTKVLVCLFIGTLLWLVKTLIIKVLASSFHVSTYFDRIQESLFNQYVVEALSGPPLAKIQQTEEEEERLAAEVQNLRSAGVSVSVDLRADATPMKSGRVIGNGGLQTSARIKHGKLSQVLSTRNDGGITIDYLHKLNTKNVSAWNMKRLIRIVRHGFRSTLDEQLLHSTHEDESTMTIRSEKEAKAAAKKIFRDVAKPGSKFIYLGDLMRFMPEDEAIKTMSLFEGAAQSKKISKSCLKKWLVNAFRERRALALTLNDTKTAVNKLHKVANVVVGIIIMIIWLLVLGIATRELLVLFSSQLLLAAFIFGNTCKIIFEAIIFLFVMHPFDVGDRCEIDGVQMFVEEMNILTTVFLRQDNQKITYPNTTLATKAIGNYYRSPNMSDTVEFLVHICTPAEKIAAMKEKINSFVESKKEHWQPSPKIIMRDIVELNRLKIAVWLDHRMNHQKMIERFVRRSLFIEEMVKIFKELDMEYRLLPLDINVCAMPLSTSERVPPSWADSS